MEGKDIQKGPKLGMLQVEIREDKQTKKKRKQKLPTNSCDSVVLALGEDHHSLPLCVVFGEVLGLLRNLRNVICL